MEPEPDPEPGARGAHKDYGSPADHPYAAPELRQPVGPRPRPRPRPLSLRPRARPRRLRQSGPPRLSVGMDG